VQPNVGAGTVSMHPIQRHIAFDDGHKLMGYYPQRWFAHHLPRAVIFRKRVVEGDFSVAKARPRLGRVRFGYPLQALSALPGPPPS
jgi:hypothetical protein